MSQEGFEAYLESEALLNSLGLADVEIPADPWRHLDGVRRIGMDMLASFSDEDKALFTNTIQHFVPSVASMDIDFEDANQIRAYLVGIGMAWRLVVDELARCTASTSHTIEHVNAALTRMMIAMEPVVQSAGVREVK